MLILVYNIYMVSLLHASLLYSTGHVSILSIVVRYDIYTYDCNVRCYL